MNNYSNTDYDKVKDQLIAKEKEIKKKKFLGLNKNSWGYISTFTNTTSVLIQVTSLLKSKDASSYSSHFVILMWILNFVYFLISVLQQNVGYALATLAFVIYNSIVLYYIYYGPKKDLSKV